MSGNDEGALRKVQKLCTDATQDRIRIATPKVSAADGATKKGVSREEQSRRGQVETNAARGMAGRVQNADFLHAELQGVTSADAFIWVAYVRGAKTHPCGLLVHDGGQLEIGLVVKNRRVGQVMQVCGCGDVIQMRMGHQDGFEAQRVRCKQIEDARYVTAGVNDDALMRVGLAKNGAIAMEGADREGFADQMGHGIEMPGSAEKRKARGWARAERNRRLLLLRRRRGVRTGQHGTASATGEHDREHECQEHEQNGRPGGKAGEQVGSATRSESSLCALATEGTGQIGALALLQQNDTNQEQADHDKEKHGEAEEKVHEPFRAPGLCG